jgi:hypothetical protein
MTHKQFLTSNIRSVILYLIIVYSSTGNVFSQKQTHETNSKIFSFGKYEYFDLPAEKLSGDSKAYSNGIVTKDSVFLMRSNNNVNGGLLHGVLTSHDLKMSEYYKCDFDVYFTMADTLPHPFFITCSRFNQSFFFEKSIILNSAFFASDSFKGTFTVIDSCLFNSRTVFSGSIYNTDFDIQNSIFRGEVELERCHFTKRLNINNTIFNNRATFLFSQYDDQVSLNDNRFGHYISWESANFKEAVEFIRCSFKDTIDFRWTKFNSTLDMRRAYFDSVNTIFLENTYYPIGKFQIYWSQLSGKNKPKICLANYSSNPEDDYRRLEPIYQTLRDNFLAQSDKASADEIMYELAWQKDLLLRQPFQYIYGIFFGYGFKPWRFLTFVVVPLLLLFAFIWRFYYVETYSIMYSKNYNMLSSTWNRNSGLGIHLFARIWQLIFFSASVLLGIRLKREWLNNKKISFTILVITEWGIGIFLYVIFAIFVKTKEFNFLKGLLGFPF